MIIRQRINDYYNLPFLQEEVDFAIPFLDEDIPLYVDPFLFWKSPSMQDNALHLAIVNSFNQLGYLFQHGKKEEAINLLVGVSECNEVGLGLSKTRKGLPIGKQTANEILNLFTLLPQVNKNGFQHFEEIQLYVANISSDRISDITCNFIKSFLIDFTIEQAERHKIPLTKIKYMLLYDSKENTIKSETVYLPVNPENHEPILLVPKRWLRFSPWINYDDYFENCFIKDIDRKIKLGTLDRVKILNFNRENYDIVQSYISLKEKQKTECKNDLLFKQMPVTSAKSKLKQILDLPTGKTDNADKKYEKYIAQIMASMLYPHLDFADVQCRTDSGAQIRDLIFYNNRSIEFFKEIHDIYNCKQIVMEMKNVNQVEREHINQVNRYLSDNFGNFGIIITRNRLTKAMMTNTIDLWSAHRKCIITITDDDLSLMCDLYESKQRNPYDVIKKKYIEFIRQCPT
jgi:hypothetical protein